MYIKKKKRKASIKSAWRSDPHQNCNYRTRLDWEGVQAALPPFSLVSSIPLHGSNFILYTYIVTRWGFFYPWLLYIPLTSVYACTRCIGRCLCWCVYRRFYSSPACTCALRAFARIVELARKSYIFIYSWHVKVQTLK